MLFLLEQVFKKYPNEVKLVHKDFPLRNQKYAQKAPAAALTANRQGKFWEFHDRLFKNANRLNDQKLQEIARELTVKCQDIDYPTLRVKNANTSITRAKYRSFYDS